MPSVTSLSQLTLINVGPLTTTWTAPASCATSTDVYLAPTDYFDEPYIASSCGYSSYGNCYPGGATQVDTIFSSAYNQFDAGVVAYYSPGLYCPDSYTTAGIAIKDGSGKIISSSGIFAPTTIGWNTIGPGPETVTVTDAYYGYSTTSKSTEVATVTFTPGYNPDWNIFMEALAPSETAVVCCPSGYSANFEGACYSNVPRSSYTPTTQCVEYVTEDGTNDQFTTVNVTYTYAGIPVTAEEELPIVTTTVKIESMTEDLDSDTSTYLTGIIIAPAATLVHTAASAGQGSSTSGDQASQTGTQGSQSGDQGAKSGARSIVSTMAAWTVGAIAGAVLIIVL
ncbi:hypothetical protein BX600DRAFT_510188 [Xylariales sp. PMI_506]|nr:hypothetical protein BX600DRAFT_510188 [Xylariales sp. PMI_506]